MKCPRCAGFLVADWCIQEDPPEALLVNRCLNCGDIMDPTILVNRQACPSFRWSLSDQVIWENLPTSSHSTNWNTKAA